MDSWSIDDWERHLGDGRPVGRFSVAELDGLPEPVQRYFRAAIALDTPMATTVSLECAVASSSEDGCRSGRSRCRTHMSASSGPPGPPASSPATTTTAVASATCTGSCSAGSTSPGVPEPTSPGAQPDEEAPKPSGCPRRSFPATASPGLPTTTTTSLRATNHRVSRHVANESRRDDQAAHLGCDADVLNERWRPRAREPPSPARKGGSPPVPGASCGRAPVYGFSVLPSGGSLARSHAAHESMYGPAANATKDLGPESDGFLTATRAMPSSGRRLLGRRGCDRLSGQFAPRSFRQVAGVLL